jgi:hypothetical protein
MERGDSSSVPHRGRGSAHVNAGDGYAPYVNCRLLAQSNFGVGKPCQRKERSSE